MSMHAIHSRFLMFGFLFFLQWLGGSYASPIAASLSGGHGSMPVIETVDVKCGRSGMNVHVTFDRPFPGVIYSKGHFYDPACNYVSSPHTDETVYSFLIPVDACGTSGELDPPNPEDDMYYENTIIIQNDPLIQEIWDEARRLKCTWKNSFSKAVHSKPLTIQSPEMVEVDFDSRSVNTLMQIQKGSSPFSSPAHGYIYVGDDTSLVIYIKDSSGKLDANAVSCIASSSKGTPVELVDRNGCLMRPSLMTPFAKMKKPKNFDADIMLYSYFKAFRIGDDPNFKVTCQLEVCEESCLEPCALGPYSDKFGRKRRKRESGIDIPSQSKTRNIIKIEHATLILGRGPTIDVKEAKERSASLECKTVIIDSLNLFFFTVFQSLFLTLLVAVQLRCCSSTESNPPLEAEIKQWEKEKQKAKKKTDTPSKEKEKEATK